MPQTIQTPTDFPKRCFISHSYKDSTTPQQLIDSLPKSVQPIIFPAITVRPSQLISRNLISTILAKLKRGDASLGAWLTLPGPAPARAMARQGFDWLLVDMEHSPQTPALMADMVAAIADTGQSAPFVRVPTNPSPPACISQTVKLLLRSPLHVLMSHQTMLLTLQGRKTGKTYTVVVTYVQDEKMGDERTQALVFPRSPSLEYMRDRKYPERIAMKITIGPLSLAAPLPLLIRKRRSKMDLIRFWREVGAE